MIKIKLNHKKKKYYVRIIFDMLYHILTFDDIVKCESNNYRTATIIQFKSNIYVVVMLVKIILLFSSLPAIAINLTSTKNIKIESYILLLFFV